jgi:hypothetical protein
MRDAEGRKAVGLAAVGLAWGLAVEARRTMAQLAFSHGDSDSPAELMAAVEAESADVIPIRRAEPAPNPGTAHPWAA